MTRFVVGIDEAGRGPLAGPLAVGVVMVREGFNIKKHFPGLKDSKLLSPSKRDELYDSLLSLAQAGEVRYTVRFASHSFIDTFGLTKAVNRSIYSALRGIEATPKQTKIFLDGSLHAPSEFEQETIIDGDFLVPIISLASVAAKVRRDRLMLRFAKKYPHYGFEEHKGYGTKKHYQALQKWGLCDIHRRSFMDLDTAQKQ